MNLMAFYQQFTQAGIELRPDSEGGRFHRGLMDILSKYENIRPEEYYLGESPHDLGLQRELFEFFGRHEDFRGRSLAVK